jgi:transposase-like protein
MVMRCDPAVVERARFLVENSVRTLEDIAVEVGASQPSLRSWIKRFGWQRPLRAPRAVPKLAPDKQEPARRFYEGGGSVADLAALLSCDGSYVHRLARRHGWVRRPAREDEEAEADAAPNPAFDALLAASCDPALSGREFGRLVGRALAITASEALASPGLDSRDRIALLGHLVRYAEAYPEEVHPSAAARRRQEEEPCSEELKETLYRRLMQIGGWDPDAPAEPAAAPDPASACSAAEP